MCKRARATVHKTDKIRVCRRGVLRNKEEEDKHRRHFSAAHDRPSATEISSRSPPMGLQPPPKRLRDEDFPSVPSSFHHSPAFAPPPASLYSRFDTGFTGTANSVADFRHKRSFDYNDSLSSSLYGENPPPFGGQLSGIGSAFALDKARLAGANSLPDGTPGFWSTGLGNRHGMGRGLGAGVSNVGLGAYTRTEFGGEDSIARTAIGTSKEQEIPTPSAAKQVKKATKGPEGTSAMERLGSDEFTGSGNNDKSPVDEEKDPDLFQLKLKTNLCKHFQAGECIFNGSCIFAHGVEELNKTRDDVFTPSGDVVSEQEEPSPAPILSVNRKKRGPRNRFGKETGKFYDWRTLQKTKVCKFFVEGTCPFGPKCSYLHGNEEKNSVRPNFSESGTLEKPPSSFNINIDRKNWRIKKGTKEGTETKFDWRKLQKTKPCKFFLVGTCPFGDKCSFLHGDEEPKPAKDIAGFAESSPSEKAAPSKPGYKTRLCTFWMKGEPCEFENSNKCRFAHGVQELRNYGTGSSIDVPFHQATGTGDYLGSKVGAVDHFPMFSNPYEIRRTNLQPFSASQGGLDGLARDFGVRNEERMWNEGIATANASTILRESYDEPKQTNVWSSMHQFGWGYF